MTLFLGCCGLRILLTLSLAFWPTGLARTEMRDWVSVELTEIERVWLVNLLAAELGRLRGCVAGTRGAEWRVILRALKKKLEESLEPRDREWPMLHQDLLRRLVVVTDEMATRAVESWLWERPLDPSLHERMKAALVAALCQRVER